MPLWCKALCWVADWWDEDQWLSRYSKSPWDGWHPIRLSGE